MDCYQIEYRFQHKEMRITAIWFRREGYEFLNRSVYDLEIRFFPNEYHPKNPLHLHKQRFYSNVEGADNKVSKEFSITNTERIILQVLKNSIYAIKIKIEL